MKTLFALTILAATSHAGEVCHTAAYPSAVTNWAQQLTVPKHNPALGALQSVTVTVKCVVTGDMGLENVLNPFVETIDAQFFAICAVQRPSGAAILSVPPRLGSHMTLGPDDGTLDFAGTSGQWLTGLQVEQGTHVVLHDVLDLALFTATVGGQTIDLGLFASGASFTTGNSGPLAFFTNMRAAADVTVCYGYREIRQSDSIPSQILNWNQPRTFAKHDPTLGPLRAVRIRARTTLTGEARFENPSPIATLVSSELACLTRIDRPDTSTALTVQTYFPLVDPLAASDGVLDFAGASGASHTGLSVETSGQSTLRSPADLALFTAIVPGETIALVVASSNSSSATGAGPIVTLFSASAGCDVEVCYDYSAPIALYCFGDGSSGACPCGNTSPVGAQQGCLNSLGLGAELRASGLAEIGADTLVLTASNMPATTTALFFQGTSAISIPFGDGVRCAGGSTTRLGTRTASAGSASIPRIGGSISNLGAATSGVTLRYQAWYRNGIAFCTSSAFNLSNGLAIAW